ncbi:MAG: ABC transporter ATP-binding protein [Deltaproteobacteria bacterium]|nr:ABC transporter ATP-binding protein [Deltaproteobacteria bacterium]MBW2150459.1 ABC transporter ATP-binding protein [Deltaproteobacteria bacterium]
METILEIKGLSKAFGGLQALTGFDLTVKRGELVGIIGPNGAGKTTIFNLITGFIRPDAGEVWFKNKNITHLKSFEIVNHGMSRTFQLVDLFKEMKVLENVMIPCYSHRARHQRSHGKKPWKVAIEFLAEMGLENRFNEQVKNLAFGELRLLDIARAMATEPDLLLLDEPFSGLDLADAKVLASCIKRMHRNGQTIVIIEHRLRDLLKLVERVVAIVFGEKIAEGTPKEIMNDQKVIEAYLGERRQ